MDTLAKWGDRWCVKAKYICSDRPEMFVHYWPIGRVQAGGFDLFKEGMEVFPLKAGSADAYKLRIAPYEYVTLYLADGGKTKSIQTSVETIPCPKVKRGIETRWNNGRWEKYLKATGWVAA